jgi:prepilin-type N-terminal cleavage/methylation domain-containing protein
MLISWQQSRTPEAGLTLLECLVAMLVVAIAVVSVTPPIFVATASRIQSRRADQARQIAQGEADRLSALIERGGYTLAQVPALGAGANAQVVPAASGSPTAILSPSTSCGSYPRTTVTATQLVGVDVDGDCRTEFLMQVYRVNDRYITGTTPGTDPPYAFDIGVRVYAWTRPTLPPGGLATIPSSLNLTTGRKDLVNNQLRPIAVTYRRLVRSDTSSSLCQIRKQANPADPCI